MDRNNLKNCSRDEGRTRIATSASRASESLSEALLSAPDIGADEGGPWDALACWYWEFYDEIERDMCRQLPDDNIPPKPLRDELVYLYFKHVHPLCPIFDEFEFHARYYLVGEELSFLQCISLLEFQAMMFCASLHLNSAQICNTNYTTTHQCHTALFETAKTTYHSCLNAPPLVLTRAALLLSYWSPYSLENPPDHYWIDQAFKNARLANLHNPHMGPTSLPPGRMRLTWWCCQMRDRLLAFGLRRIHSLHEETITSALPTLEDFGLEAEYPHFMDPSSKWISINNFIRLCELGQIITGVLKFQQERQFATEHDALKCGRLNELRKVTLLHVGLSDWRQRFEASLGDNSINSPPGSCNMPCQLTQIFCASIIASLYLPYISLESTSSNPVFNEFSEVALVQVKNAASYIAKSTEILAYKTDSNDIPLGLGAWITFPIAAKLVFIRNSTGLEDPATELQEMRSLLNVLHILRARFISGQFISNVLDVVNSHIFRSAGKGDCEDGIGLLQDAEGIIERGLAYGIVPT